MSVTPAPHQDRGSQWVPNNSQNPIKTDIELPSEPIHDNARANERDYQASTAPPPSSPPRLLKSSATSPNATTGSPSRSAGQSSVVDPLVAAKFAMRASSPYAVPGPAASGWHSQTVSAIQGPPRRLGADLSAQRMSQNETYGRVMTPPPAVPKDSGESETRDLEGSYEDDESRHTEETRSLPSEGQVNGAQEHSPSDDESGVNRAEDTSASMKPASADPPFNSDESRPTALDSFISDTQIQQETGNDDDGTSAPEQDNDKGISQQQAPGSGLELSVRKSNQAQEGITVLVEQHYFNSTISGIDDAVSVHSGESNDETKAGILDQSSNVCAADGQRAADPELSQIPPDDLDTNQQVVPDAGTDRVAASQDALYCELEEFLAARKIPRKVGYGCLVTFLDWAFDLEKLRDMKLDGLARRSADILETLQEDADARKRLQHATKLVEDDARKLRQELSEVKRDLEACSENLNISDQKLKQMEVSERSSRDLLSQYQVDLSTEKRVSKFYKDQLEKAKNDLDATRQELQDANVNLGTERRHNNSLDTRIRALENDLNNEKQELQDVRVDLESVRRHNNSLNMHIKALERDLDTEKQVHHEDITRYSRYIDSIEQDKRDLEDTVGKVKEEVAALEAAYERQKVEHAEVVQALQRRHDAETQATRDEHASVVQGLHSQHDDYVRRLKGQHAEKARTLQLQHDGQMQNLRAAHAEKMQSAQSQHAREVQDLRGEHDRESKELESQLLQLRTQRDQEVKMLRDKIQQDEKEHTEEISRIQAEGARKVKTEVANAIKEKQQRIDVLQGAIVGSQDKSYVQISDSSFVQLLESISQQITNLSAGVGRPSAHLFDRSLDPTNYLEKNPHERDRRWTVFVRSVCWSVILPGFFENPLGFGCLGNEGEGFQKLYHLYLLFCRPTSDGTSLEFLNDKATNVWRASFFDAFLRAVKASPNAAQQHEGQHAYPAMFKAHVDHVVRALTDKLLRLSNRQLDSRVPSQIFKVVYDTGILSLQMGSQRAQVELEPCESGEVIRAGDHFIDEGGLTGIDTTVGLMTQPCMVRVGDGSIDMTSEHIIAKGRFVSSRS
ncbi:hypothetical protein B0T16DRAFT_462453 [Cercophora newfieldiana]|uniref:Uncharacterized protein n=1 Tax=Cercophora newfieldiana TaxID=92897 RepID=A0AA39XS72_9PEZI|nr:hypothetical protein B0T16DRAFT_462453 [Cercophora newfieldiana]